MYKLRDNYVMLNSGLQLYGQRPSANHALGRTTGFLIILAELPCLLAQHGDGRAKLMEMQVRMIKELLIDGAASGCHRAEIQRVPVSHPRHQARTNMAARRSPEVP